MSTPMFSQYDEIKARHRDAILLFRLGDFYEMFGPDAQDGARVLGLTLTQRQGRPMCGVPHHAARGYIGRLLNSGRKVAICEQVSLPDGKNITRREVVEVLSPGAVFDPDYLESAKNNYIVALGRTETRTGTEGGILAIAACDVSVGELVLAAFPTDNGAETDESVIRRELERLDPVEILVQESLLEKSTVLSTFSRERRGRVVNRIPDWGFDIAESVRRLQEHLGVTNLHGFGFDDNDPALLPAATILDYLHENAHHTLNHIQDVTRHEDNATVILDDATVRNLEIVRNIRDGGQSYTLIDILDQSCTPMGSRRLRNWLLQPLRDMGQIERRLHRVDDLYHRQHDLQSLRARLDEAYDLERLIGRLGIEKAHPKDLLAIAQSLVVALETGGYVTDWYSGVGVADTEAERQAVETIADDIASRIAPDAPITINEGGIFRHGYDEELDRLRSLRDNSKSYLDAYLQEQRAETGITSLKIKYNRMLGHFFEMPRSQAGRIPESFIRRQSLANAERFTTARLGEIESELNNADSAALEREQSLFLALRTDLLTRIPLLRKIAARLAEIDATASLARAATLHGYRRPTLVAEPGLKIVAGRHPIVEANLPPGEFIANDLFLGNDTAPFALITGPNMAGKSTVLRQTALIALMAHIGSFVPAEEAIVGLCDRIFCRVGASDNIARGESTFLVEMNETSNILRNATERSIVIMDEVGRGTSTHDGLSIAWAVCEYLLDHIRSRTLFATHYHELTGIEHVAFRALSMAVEHSGEQIYFLKRLVAGGDDHSYGVDVARLAGLPEPVIRRARDLLAHFESHGTGGTADASPDRPGPRPVPEVRRAERGRSPDELFSPGDLLLDEIRGTSPDNLTPRVALDLIYRWHAAITGKREGE
ncbi:MAG: DNA mismatch repair protein MutS [Spirochaeta sp.]|jgi:DNA mismatch repair protein MutS|nr:DNA mismatch repair protein MutS [Spirochaeta sp.]